MCAPGCIEFHEPSATLDVIIKVELGQLHDIVLESDVPRSGAANLVGSEIKGQSRRELLEMTNQQTQRWLGRAVKPPNVNIMQNRQTILILHQ